MRYILGLFLLVVSSLAFGQGVGIASGNTTGTNYPMAADIAKVCSTSAAPINNIVSDGSIDNIFKIHGDRRTQYGIIQADALEYQKGLDPKMMDRILMVFPFFSVEMHLYVREGSNIRSINDLAGKRVVEGPDGSGTWVSVQVIKALTKIQWQGLQMTQKAGHDALMSGAVDAHWIVAGKPIGILKSANGVRLVPVQHAALSSFGLYTPTMIETGVYPFQKGAVQTYKVDNVLATYAFKNQYQKEIGSLVSCIASNIDRLQRDPRNEGFHPKWRDVDPADIDRIKWPAHPAAKAAINNIAGRR